MPAVQRRRATSLGSRPQAPRHPPRHRRHRNSCRSCLLRRRPGAPAVERTAAELAASAGRPEVVALLVELGCPAPVLSTVDALVAAALAADFGVVDRVRTEHPGALAAALDEHPGLVVRAAAAGRADAVRLLVDMGFAVDALVRADLPLDEEWETALHCAAGRSSGSAQCC